MKTSKQRREQRKRALQRTIDASASNESKERMASIFNSKCGIPCSQVSKVCEPIPTPCRPINSPPVEILYQQMVAHYEQNSLATFPVCNEKQEQENTMITTNTIPAEKTYLANRLDHSFYKARDAQPTKFGLTDDERPRTANELVARITAGTYIVNKDRGDSRAYDPMDNIRWRDPKVVEDKVGYAAAEKVLKLAYTAAKDQIIVKDIDTGLTALQAFETANLPAN